MLIRESVLQLVIADLLKNRSHELATEPMQAQAKNDVFRMIQILQLNSEHDVVARIRVSELQKYL